MDKRWSAIPCVLDGFVFSCSNKSTRISLEVEDVRCIVGAASYPEVQTLDSFRGGVVLETTMVNLITSPVQSAHALCTARVYLRVNTRCALPPPTGGLNAELKLGTNLKLIDLGGRLLFTESCSHYSLPPEEQVVEKDRNNSSVTIIMWFRAGLQHGE